MRHPLRAHSACALFGLLLATTIPACGSSSSDLMGQTAGGSAGAAGQAGAPDQDAQADVFEPEAGDQDAQLPDAVEEPVPSAADPALPGPCTSTTLDGKAGGNAVHCYVPADGPDAAPYPIVLLAHGFSIESNRYNAYAERLSTFCYVACTVEYSNLAGQDQDPIAISAALDWALSAPALAGKVDPDRAGTMGHSRGGKAAVMAAVADARFKAVLGLDPVNACPSLGSGCPNALQAIQGLAVPTTFLGETLDSQAAAQACAPAADNYQQFYASAQSPSLEVTVNGANHMSFVADLSNCLACGFCKPATADHQAVLDLSLSYSVAFFQRWLRAITAYDDYLSGPVADQRYVQTGLATLQTK